MLNGKNGATGPNVQPLVARGSNLVNQPLETTFSALENFHIFIFSFSVQSFANRNSSISIPIQELTASGKSGENGPTATPLARVPENSELESARLPCSEATTALATQLRRLHALILAAAQALCRASEPWSLLINHLVKTPPAQVGFNP